MIANKTAVEELRKDMQGAVHGISQQVGSSGPASAKPDSSETQAMRAKLEEVHTKYNQRCDDVLQRAQSVVESLRITDVHRQLGNLDATLSQVASQLGSRSDDFD